VTARARCEKLDLTLYILNDKHLIIFDTSTQRLGHDSFTLDEGSVFSCTFELQLDMVSGIYYPSALIWRYDTQTKYDEWEPATTIYISAEDDVKGVVHCSPKVVRQEIRGGMDENPTLIAGNACGDRDADSGYR